MRTEIISVSPMIAKNWLEHNTKNRNIRISVVERYAEQMKNGEWDLTGQGITFDTDGTLLDGQHRLYAIVMSGVTVEMLVVWDAPKSYGYDCGLKRNMSDRIYMKDSIKIKPRDSAVAQLAIEINNKIKQNKSVLVESKKELCSPVQVTEWIKKYLEDINRINEITEYKRGETLHAIRSAPVMLALLSAYKAGNDINILKDWCTEVSIGIQCRENLAAILYRNLELRYSRGILGRYDRLRTAQLSLLKYTTNDPICRLRITSKFSYDIPE